MQGGEGKHQCFVEVVFKVWGGNLMSCRDSEAGKSKWGLIGFFLRIFILCTEKSKSILINVGSQHIKTLRAGYF